MWDIAGQNLSLLPAISDCRRVDLIPGQGSQPHRFELIDCIDVSRCHLVVVAINGSCNKLAAVVGFEAPNDPCIVRLDICSQITTKILDSDV